MSPGGEDGTSSAVPADLRAYSRAALEIDEQIHQLALRLGRVLDAYRATNPEFGDPIPRIEDDLARYAQFCRDVDLRVGRIADAFEHAGALPPGVAGPPAPSSQPVVVSEALLAQAVQVATTPPPKEAHHDGGGLFGGLLHAVEHPVDTLGDMASGAEHLASDAVGAVGDAGSALVHAIEHPSEDLAAAATGLEQAAGGVRDFAGYVADEATKAEKRQLDVVGDVLGAVEHPADTAQAVEAGLDRLGDRALVGLEALGGRMLHDIEHPIDGLKDVAQAQEEFLSGFASGVKDMAQAAMLLARVVPGTPLWAASMAIDPVGTMKLQEQFATGLMHMAADPGEALGNMIDIKDLEAGNFARWEGHITPDVIVTLLTAGGGGAAAAVGEGVAKTAAEATAEQAAKTLAEGAAESVAEGGVAAGAEDLAGGAAATDARAAADAVAEESGRAAVMGGEFEAPPPLSVARVGVPAAEDLTFEELMARYGDRLTVDGRALTERELEFARVTPNQVADALAGVAPLGTTPAQWAELQATLNVALRESGLEGVELELGGSSTRFFAGRAKPFPVDAADAAAQAAKKSFNEAEAAARYEASPYAATTSRPTRHFFDSRYHLGTDLKSDLDFSIRSATVDARMAEFQAQHPEIKDLISPAGNVYKTRYLQRAFPELGKFMDRWTEELGGREVNIVGRPVSPP